MSCMEKSKFVLKIVVLIFVFVLGIFISRVFNLYGNGFNGLFTYNVLGRVVDTGNYSGPSNFLNDSDILVYPDKIVIKIENVQISNYDSSNSMEPFIGKGANGIVVKPGSEKDVNVGDVITFRRGDKLIVHRVIEKGIDTGGVYFITKGDNSDFVDGKVRFNEIEHKLAGILY